MQRFFLTTLLFIGLVEVYSLLPLRIENRKADSTVPFVVGALHIPLHGKNLKERARELALQAKEEGIDFLVFANLGTTLPKDIAESVEGVDLFTEYEASTPAGHALLFHSHTGAADLSDTQLKQLAWKHFNGSESHPGVFVVVAHPSSVLTPWERLDRFPEGIELINVRSLIESQALENPLAFAMTLLIFPFNSYMGALRLSQPNARDFRGWDAVNTVSPGHFGIVATDDLSDWPGMKALGLHLIQRPPIGVATNILFPDAPLSEDFATRRRQIYRNLREGRSALLFQSIHPFPGNDWAMVCGEKTYRSGDKFALHEPGCEFQVRTPSSLPFARKLVLIRDGETVNTVTSSQPLERFPIEQDGSYRLEVWLKQTSLFGFSQGQEVPYLLYNPLYVR
jgi:hypothetical protein